MAFAVFAATMFAVAKGEAAETRSYRMITLTPGSTNYEIMVAFAEAARKYVPDTTIELDSNTSLTDAMLQLAQDKVDFVTVVWDFAQSMSEGNYEFENAPNAAALFKNLRGVFYFPTGVPHFLTFADSGIKAFHDLKGKTIFIGSPHGKSADFFKKFILDYTGLAAGVDYFLSNATFTQAYQDFWNGKIDAVVYFGSSPRDKVQIAAIARKVRVIGIPESELQAQPALRAALSGPGRSIGCIPTDFYGPNQQNEEPQCYHRIWLGVATRKTLSDDLVYAVTKAFWGNIEDFYTKEYWENIGNANSERSIQRSVALENALSQMNIPLHPGAERYYREQGLSIPEPLVANK